MYLCQLPYLACQAIWFSGQAHLVHISIITQHAVLHLLLFFSVTITTQGPQLPSGLTPGSVASMDWDKRVTVCIYHYSIT